MPINPTFAKKYAEFKGITEADLKDAYGDDMTQIEADLKQEGLSVSDFGEPAPEPAAPSKPYGSQNDPNNFSGRIKEIMDYVRTVEQTGTEEGVRKVRAEANREIEDLHSKFGSGSVEEWVRSQMSGGAPKRNSKLGSAAGMLQSVVSPAARSRIGKIAPSIARAITGHTLATEATMAPTTLGGIYNVGETGTESSLYGEIETAAEKAAADRAYGKNPEDLSAEEKAAVENRQQSIGQQVSGAVSGVAQQVANDPREFLVNLAGDVVSPANVATEAITGPGFAAAKQAMRATKTGRRLARIVGSDPLRDVGAVRPRTSAIANAASRVAEETVQGALSEAAQTGDVTAAGTVMNIAPAVAGTVIRSALTPSKVANAAARETPVSAPEPAPEPVAPQVQEPSPVAETVASPSPVTPVAPQGMAPTEPAVPVEPTPITPVPSRKNQPRDTEATRAAKKLAKKEEALARSDAESQIALRTKKAKEYAKAGMAADAEKLLDDARPHYDKVWGPSADFVFNKDKEVLAVEAKRLAEKAARVSKIREPKTITEAKKQVEAAIADGTPEAIEAARPALEVLNPVADDAAKAIDDMKAAAEPAVPEAPVRQPKIKAESPAEAAPAKKQKKTKEKKAALEPQEDPSVRPVLMGSAGRNEMMSESDWMSNPVEYTAATYITLSDRAVAKDLIDLGRPDLAKELRSVVKSLEDRRQIEVDTENGPITYDWIIEQAEDEFYGTPLSSVVMDPTNVLVDKFADDLGVARQDVVDAVTAAQFSAKEKAVVNKVINELREDKIVEDPSRIAARIADQAELDARVQAEISAGNEVPIYNKAISDDGDRTSNQRIFYSLPIKDPIEALKEVKGLVSKISESIGYNAQRISDEFTEMTDEARKRGGSRAAEVMDRLQMITRSLDNSADLEIARKMTELNNVIRKIPEVGVGYRSLMDVSDALEGKKVELNEWQQELHDVIRGILDEQGLKYEQVTGNKMRRDYFTRVEEKGVINSAVKNFADQVKASGLSDELSAETMTLDKAKEVVNRIGKVKDPMAERAILNQSAVLQSLFEKDANGKVSLAKDKDGTPLVDRESAYLLMMPEDGSLPPMMPDFFEKYKDGEKFKVRVKSNVDMPDPESFKALMDAEAMRILANREDYDPDSKSGKFYANTARWQLDGSLASARLMPYLGDEFYDRNPINVMAHIIPRQTRGLMRQEVFGRNKEVLLSELSSLVGPFKPEELGLVKTGDSYRLATQKDGSAYSKSLLRSIEDVSMGYMRPFTEETGLHRIGDQAGKLARFYVLSGKLLNTAANEIAQAAAAAAYGSDVAASYAANRAKVAAMHMESGGRRALESVTRSATPAANLLEAAGAKRASKLVSSMQKEALSRLVDGDPISQADVRAMSDASTLIGATRYDRALNGLSNLIGSFTQSNKAADIAAHYTGYSMFNDMVARRMENPKAFDTDAGLLEEDLKRTVSKEKLDRAATLLDSQGWPKSADAAEEILRIAGPFISEFKSKLSGRSNPLFQPKVARQRWARGAMWLSMIPFSIASGQISAIRRAYKSGNPREALKRASKLGLAGAGATYLTVLARQNPAMSAMVGAGLTGQYPAAALAYTGTGGEYNPDDEYANAQMAAMQSDWNRGEGAENLIEKGLLLADMSSRAMWKPRFMQTDVLSDAESRLAGQRTSRRSIVETIGESAVPGIIAAGQQVGNIAGDLSLVPVAANEGRPGQASSMAFASLAAPSVREGMAKRRAELRQRGVEQVQRDPEAINEKIRPLTEAGGVGLLMSKIRKIVNLNTRD